MKKFIVAGIGTNVGKTITSAILTTLCKGDYWKPVQTGCILDSDSNVMAGLLDSTDHQIFNPVYSLKAPLAPHHAARLENVEIDPNTIKIPHTTRPLIIESAGGILVPLTNNFTTLDLFKMWDCQWIIVSKHYLGSINHTLLTLEVLKSHRIDIAGIIFNGELNVDSESAILNISQVPFLARVLPEKKITKSTIKRYAQQWQTPLAHLLP